MGNESEQKLVKVSLENYLKAHETGKSEFIREAFHKDARITAVSGGKLLNLSVNEFACRFNEKPAADEASRKRRIEILDISGDAAFSKIILDYPTVKLTDYISLLRIDGTWQIVHKSYYAERKEQKNKIGEGF
ncbi:MAG: nuclear transport factor 2 family protein [Acidobacteriota bacterium]|nr:nuclear transport factor 2 family protein [Acidobacteriota bacterium]